MRANQHRHAASTREADRRCGAEVTVAEPEVARVAVLARHQVDHQAGIGVKDDKRVSR